MYLLFSSFMLIFCLHSPAKEIMMTKKIVRKRDISACRCVCLFFLQYSKHSSESTPIKSIPWKSSQSKEMFIAAFSYGKWGKKKMVKNNKNGWNKEELALVYFYCLSRFSCSFLYSFSNGFTKFIIVCTTVCIDKYIFAIFAIF